MKLAIPSRDTYSRRKIFYFAIPMMASLVLGLIGAWMFGIPAFIIGLTLSTGAYYLYTLDACCWCTNDCPMNKNADYREWLSSGYQ